MSYHSGIVDTTEMYLRTVLELEEEGIVPLRARIGERLGQSGPTVSQTVARMERDGLMRVADDRQLELSDKGREDATAVMRKHRLAERLLADVIGMDWEQLHIEACRWEHVMSEDAERRILALLAPPFVCPHGNPIPGLADLGVADSDLAGPPNHGPGGLLTLTAAAARAATVSVELISERLQSDAELMHRFVGSGLRPGTTLRVRRVADGVEVRPEGPAGVEDSAGVEGSAGAGGVDGTAGAEGTVGPADADGVWALFPAAVAAHVFVRVLDRPRDQRAA